MVKHSRLGKVRLPKETKSTLSEVKLSLYKKCTEISLLYDIQIFVAISDDKHNLSVLSTKTEVSEYISSTLKVPLNATEIFTSKSVSILFYMQFSNNDTESSDSEEEDDHKDKDSSLVNATTLSQTFTNLTDHKKNNYRIKIPLLNAKASINGKEFNVIKNNKNNLILFKNKERPQHNPSIGTTDNNITTKRYVIYYYQRANYQRKTFYLSVCMYYQ